MAREEAIRRARAAIEEAIESVLETYAHCTAHGHSLDNVDLEVTLQLDLLEDGALKALFVKGYDEGYGDGYEIQPRREYR